MMLRIFALSEVAEARRISEGRRFRGKLVLKVRYPLPTDPRY